jgi:hypothetical protein
VIRAGDGGESDADKTSFWVFSFYDTNGVMSQKGADNDAD